MIKQTIHDVQYAMIRHNPVTLSEFEKLGIHLSEIGHGNGAFRDVYKVRGLPLVVKIPKANDADSSIDHAIAEYEAIRKINRFKKYERLRKYIPDVFYFSYESGIILMDYCKPLGYTKANCRTADVLSELVEECWSHRWEDVSSVDVCCGNIGLKNRDVKIIDLGCFLEN